MIINEKALADAIKHAMESGFYRGRISTTHCIVGVDAVIDLTKMAAYLNKEKAE